MSDSLEAIADGLARRLDGLRPPAPVSHVYHPLDYARDLHAQYLERYGSGRREIVLVGMNPGPWGMVQTGVPFGQVDAVKNWMKLEGQVNRPALEHPKVPVRGLQCPRSEVSGARLWGWARRTYGTPERFFSRFFVINYCPLAFLEASGRNLAPDKLPAKVRRPIETACDHALQATVGVLRPRFVIGIGAFAERRARVALDESDVTIARILHPSPASPAANRGWSRQATAQLRRIGIDLPPVRSV